MNWIKFDEMIISQFIGTCCFLLVWDVRVNEPRRVKLENGWMTEENGRRYSLSNNKFYSHFCLIWKLNIINPASVNDWIRDHGVRLGVDK